MTITRKPTHSALVLLEQSNEFVLKPELRVAGVLNFKQPTAALSTLSHL